MKKEKSWILVLISAVLLVGNLLVWPVAAQISEKVNIIQVRSEGRLEENGTLQLNMTWKFPNNVFYTELKRNFPNPYVIIRELTSSRAGMEFESPEVRFDDARRVLLVSAQVPGFAVCRHRFWEIDMGKSATLVYQDGKKIILREILPLSGDVFAIHDFYLDVPAEANQIQFDEESHILRYNVPIPKRTGEPYLQVNLQVKPRVMSAAYKAYANPELEDGTQWIAKTVFKNTGEANIRNLKVRYRLGQYTSWSPPSRYTVIVPSGSVTDLYYPIISNQVCNLKTPTPVDLEVEFSYEDEDGNVYEDYRVKRLNILGINQIEFSKWSPEETTGTWLELFSNLPMATVFVTHLDAPVKEFAGMASRLAGGVAAAANDKDATSFCKALYDLEVTNGIVYQTPSGFLTEYSPGQDIKYPRDVLRDKSGTCIDLAILYASVCEAVGLKTYLVFIPGHAFPIVELPSGDLLPVETTAVGGRTVGIESFEKAVEAGFKNLRELRMGEYLIVSVSEMRQKGVVSPELPALPANILQEWGYKLPEAQANQDHTQAPAVGNEGQNPAGPEVNTSIIDGVYQGKAYNRTTGEEANFTFHIQTQGNMVTGQCQMEAGYVGSGPLQGQVQGNRLVFVINSQVYDQLIQINCDVTINGGILQGTFVIPIYGCSGTFKGQKVQ